MNVLIASDDFIVRHVLGEALNWDHGVLTCGSDNCPLLPFQTYVDVAILSLDFRRFSAIDIAAYFREINPDAILIGLYKGELFTESHIFDRMYPAPYGHTDAKKIVRDFLNGRDLVNNNKNSRIHEDWEPPRAY